MSDKLSSVKINSAKINELMERVLSGEISLDDLDLFSANGKVAHDILENYYKDKLDKKG
jgi:hypothetical protein